jgi:predicted metalloprotease with PDZ domain
MHQTRAYERVYWSGAAWALAVDVALRGRSGRVPSLDHALASIQDETRRAQRSWSAEELCRLLDRRSGTGLFTRLGGAYTASGTFPDIDETLRFLGLGSDGGPLAASTASQIALRDSIMLSRPGPPMN